MKLLSHGSAKLRSAVLTFAVLAVAVLSVPATVSAQKKGGGGTTPPADPAIVVPYYGGGRTQLVVMNADGSNATILATNARHQSSQRPSFSPDGHSIAFTSGTTIVVIDLVVQNGVPKAINERALLTNDSALEHIRWSPAGHEIGFVTSGLQGPGIYSIPSTGGVPMMIYSGQVGDFCWSPGGATIAAKGHSSREDWDYVRLINRATGEDVAWHVPQPGTGLGIDWGRTNGKLALGVRNDAGDVTDVMLLDAVPGSQPQRLYVNGMAPVWSPDDRQLAFSKLLSSGWTLFRKDLATGAEIKLLKSVNTADWRRF